MMQSPSPAAMIERTTAVVSAYVANNPVPSAGLADLIVSTHAALARLSAAPATVAKTHDDRVEAAQIRKSIREDGLVSFLDGRSYKTLKRHLTSHGMTPATYRTRFGLPDDYPLVAPSYSRRRSDLAKATGLGVPAKKAAHPRAA